MHLAHFHGRYSKLCFIVLLVLAVLLPLSGMVVADDSEDPWIPLSVSDPEAGADFGDTYVENPDIIGSVIDARDAVEPQLTASLIMGEIDTSPSETVIVSTQPTFEVDVYLQ